MTLVRRANRANIDEIVRLKGELISESWPFEMDLDADWRARCAAVARELMDSGKTVFFVIDADAPSDGPAEGHAPKLAACASVSIEQHLPSPGGTGRSAYIGDMCTEPAYRGRGYGTALLDAVMAWAKEQGAGWASLFSTEQGRSIYVKAGFDPKGPFEHMSVDLH